MCCREKLRQGMEGGTLLLFVAGVLLRVLGLELLIASAVFPNPEK